MFFFLVLTNYNIIYLGPEEIFCEIGDSKCSFLQSEKISFAVATVASMSIKFQNKGQLSFFMPVVIDNDF